MKQVRVYNLNYDFCCKERENGNCYSFMGLDDLKKQGLKVEKSHYDLIWEGEIEDSCGLEGLFKRMQGSKPEGWKGHSLSVSDVVEMDGVAHYCDDFGWAEVNW